MLTALLVDDEPLANERMRGLLAARGRSRFVGDDVLDDYSPIAVEPHGPYLAGAVSSRLNTSTSSSR